MIDISSRKKRIMDIMNDDDAHELYEFLDVFSAPHAVAYVLSMLAEDEVSETAAKILYMLKQKIDPNNRDKWNE